MGRNYVQMKVCLRVDAFLLVFPLLLSKDLAEEKIYIYMYVCMYVCVCVYICVYIYNIYIYVCVCSLIFHPDHFHLYLTSS